VLIKDHIFSPLILKSFRGGGGEGEGSSRRRCILLFFESGVKNISIKRGVFWGKKISTIVGNKSSPLPSRPINEQKKQKLIKK
jgi:hypothetical protein